MQFMIMALEDEAAFAARNDPARGEAYWASWTGYIEALTAARRDANGAFVPLDQQDVSRWSREQIEQAERHLALALAQRRVGPYQLHAAIQSVHNRRAFTGVTDWAAIAALYDGLVAIAPTVGAHVARAKARTHTDGPAAGLALLDELPPERVVSYQPYWVVRAYCLATLGDAPAATQAARTAIALTVDPAVRRYLEALYRAPA